MTAVQTERYAPQLATGRPHIDTYLQHAWTGVLAAGCTTTALGAGLCLAGTLVFTINPLSHGPVWQLAFAIPLGSATWRLGRWTWALVRKIKGRA